jgi:uncharacterized membrane protein
MIKLSLKKITLEKSISWILIIAGVIGLLMSGIIMWEKMNLLQNPSYIPSCNLNPVLGCGPVTKSKQASAFGIPNPFIGLSAFAIVVTSGVVILAGAKLKRWYWLGLELGAIFGIGFTHWLFFESVYRIHSLCIYCMVVWVVTITIFLYVTLFNLRKKYIKTPPSLLKVESFVQSHHIDILVLWLLIIAGLILKHFWYYYGAHLKI